MRSATIRPTRAQPLVESPPEPARASVWVLRAAVVCALMVPSTGPAVTYWNLAKLALAGIGLAHLLLNHPTLRPNRTAAWVAILIGSPILSLQLTGLDELISALATLAFAVMVALAVQSTPVTGYLRVLRTTVTVIALESVLGLVQLVTGAFPTWGYQGDGARAVVGANELLSGLGFGRAVATFGHPVPFGMVCAVGLALVSSPRLVMRPWVRVLLAVTIGGGLLASGTRSAALAAAVGMIAAVLFGRSGDRRPLRLVVTVLAAGLAAVWLNWYFGISESLQGSFSLTHRVNSLTGGLRLLDRPVVEVLLGSGPDGAARAFTGGFITDDGSLAIDNQLVWSFAVGGLVQLVALIVLLARAVAGLVSVGSDLALLFVVMLFSFDFLAWNATMTLFVVLIASPWLSRRPAGAGAGGRGSPPLDPAVRSLRCHG